MNTTEAAVELMHAVPLPAAAWLVPALPLLGAIVNLFFGKRLGKWAGVLASATIGMSFLISLGLLANMLSLPTESRTMIGTLYRWIAVGPMDVGITGQLDPLSMTMLLVVTGVGFLIHVYAIGYMEGDARFGRFFAYLNLFVFFMLVLVLAGDYVLMYVGWEGVGLCSFLLIGFWFEKPAASSAAKKAFVVTRIGDTLMFVGLALMFVQFGTFAFADVLNPAVVQTVAEGTRTAIALLLLCGAIGKSAQFPLHVWLPDAMAGPTPVSALIHAATMVTAGVYLVVRSIPLFTPVALEVVGIIGLVSAVYGAMASIGQDDMKRALAYSTMSQLGFMFLAAGLGVPSLAIALLVVHAIYKSMMFLGAGSVMHGTDGETDMKRMGGLRKAMPITAITFFVGAYSLSGLPPLAGYFAKDPIIAFADESGDVIAWIVALAAAVLSALYIARIAFLAFTGRPRADLHAHESPRMMTIPMILLAIGAVLVNMVILDPQTGLLEVFLAPVLGEVPEAHQGLPVSVLTAIGIATAIFGVLIAWLWYGRGRDWIGARAKDPAWHRALATGFFVNAAYDKMVDPALLDGAQLLADFDSKVIDGGVNGIGRLTLAAAAAGRRVQTGLVRTYALSFAFGVALILLMFEVMR